MDSHIYKYWWLLAIKGLLAVSFGALVFITNPVNFSDVTGYFSMLLIICGLILLFGALKQRPYNSEWAWWLFEGLFEIIVGILLISNPAIAEIALLTTLSFWALTLGLVQIVSSYNMRQLLFRHKIRIFTGFLFIVLSIMLNMQPFKDQLSLLSLIALFSTFYGFITMFTAYRLRKLTQTSLVSRT